jgi:hypothetical protein
MASYSNPRGPAPKPESKRRRYAKPESYGAAEPTVAPAAHRADRQLGFDDPHPLIAAMWDTVADSCEAAFYSEADWARARLGVVVRESGDDRPPAVRECLGGDPVGAE